MNYSRHAAHYVPGMYFFLIAGSLYLKNTFEVFLTNLLKIKDLPTKKEGREFEDEELGRNIGVDQEG